MHIVGTSLSVLVSSVGLIAFKLSGKRNTWELLLTAVLMFLIFGRHEYVLYICLVFENY